MGSMRDARRAGTHADNTAKEVSNKVQLPEWAGRMAARRTTWSSENVPKRQRPTTPAKANRKACPTTTTSTLSDVAPRAMRMPISWVRCADIVGDGAIKPNTGQKQRGRG